MVVVKWIKLIIPQCDIDWNPETGLVAHTHKHIAIKREREKGEERRISTAPHYFFSLMECSMQHAVVRVRSLNGPAVVSSPHRLLSFFNNSTRSICRTVWQYVEFGCWTNSLQHRVLHALSYCLLCKVI